MFFADLFGFNLLQALTVNENSGDVKIRSSLLQVFLGAGQN